MSNIEMQSCLARLYVDDLFLRVVQADRREAARHYDLTEREFAAIDEIDFEQLEIFSRTLKTKRRRKLSGSYPATFTLDADVMNRFVLRYFQIFRVHGTGDPLGDVLNFGPYIEECLATAEGVPAWAAEVARFEALQNIARAGRGATEQGAAGRRADADPVSDKNRPILVDGVLFEEFTYDVIELSEALIDSTPPADTSQGAPYGLVFTALYAGGDPKTFRLSQATLVVLQACRGIWTPAQIVAETERRLGVGGLGAQVRDVLSKLRDIGLIKTDWSQ